MTKMEAKLMRELIHRTARARGALTPSPEQATVEIQGRGGKPYAPGCWGFPDGSVLRCNWAGNAWQWTAFGCDPRPNPSVRHRTTHKE